MFERKINHLKEILKNKEIPEKKRENIERKIQHFTQKIQHFQKMNEKIFVNLQKTNLMIIFTKEKKIVDSEKEESFQMKKN